MGYFGKKYINCYLGMEIHVCLWCKFVVAHQLKPKQSVYKVDWENIPWFYDLATKDYNLWGSNSIRENSCPLRDDIIACEATI